MAQRIKDMVAFSKLRLSFLVVISAVSGYLFAADSVDWSKMLALCLGGFLVTASSNGFNQVLEREVDKLMHRTRNRPIPSGRMNATEGVILASIMGIGGLLILWFFLNPLSFFLGLLALVLYVGIYTPMKKASSWAVFVGAFPGAIPPMLGYIAHSGTFGFEPGILFFVQFMWQFPHFWAVAWVADEDYKRAGYRLLPSKEGKGKKSSFMILLYTLLLVPVSLTPWLFNLTGITSLIVVSVIGLLFYLQAQRLHRTNSDKHAKALMFGSFAYLPIVQFAYVLDKL